MDKVLQRVSQLGDEYVINVLGKWFERIQRMKGANRILRRITSAPNKEQFEDYLAEVRYALIFAGLGFQVEIEPDGGKGPDLKVSRDGHQAIVEIMRFRKVYPGPPVLDFSDGNLILPAYGNPPRDIRKAFEKILTKFPQIENQQAIIAIWNDEEELEEVEVEAAVINMRRDADRHLLSIPSGLLFVLYGSKWMGNRQLYCFPLRGSDQPYQVVWRQELDTSTVNHLIQLALTQP